MPGKWDIDHQSAYARYPEFEALRPELQHAIVDEARENIVKQICAQTEAVVRDAIPKALEAQVGLAYKSELLIDEPRPIWDTRSKVVTHQVRFVLCDAPPNREWNWLPYEQLKELWEKHCVQPQKA